MLNMRRVGTVVLLCMAATMARASENTFADPLDMPSLPNKYAQRSHLSDVAIAGNHAVAVGARGMILVSDANAETWRQVQAPVSSDLLAVFFVTPEKGWVVGHDGVVLHTANGGEDWERQFDGRQAKALLTRHFSAQAAAGIEDADYYLNETELNYADGPEQALLDVWFENERSGFVVGSFGTLFRTEDGGKSWQSWTERVNHNVMLHYNAVTGVDGDVFLASEEGVVFRLAEGASVFEPLETGYSGSYFNVMRADGGILALGLRGNAYFSTDGGDNWRKVSTATSSSITDGLRLADGRVALATQNGQLLISESGINGFTQHEGGGRMLYTGVAQITDQRLVLVGLNGVQVVDIEAASDGVTAEESRQ